MGERPSLAYSVFENPARNGLPLLAESRVSQWRSWLRLPLHVIDLVRYVLFFRKGKLAGETGRPIRT